MTNKEIATLPTITDLDNFQRTKIQELQAAGTYNYETLQPIITERDSIVARETVEYARECGCDGFEVIYGTASERMIKRNAVIRTHSGPCAKCKA